MELPLRVELYSGGTPGPLQVVDLSFGGMAFQTAGALRDVSVGDELTFIIGFGNQEALEVRGVVRHGSGEREGLTGVEFTNTSEEVQRAIRRYVSELFERGLSV